VGPQLHPLRGAGNDEDGTQSPEALLISAFLEIGDFSPERYHVVDDDIMAWSKLWAFAREYQTYSGEAPPVSLVKKQFPDFEITKDVSPVWAAAKVVEASAMRDMRGRVQDVVRALGDENMGEALELFEGVQRPRGFKKEPLDPFDHTALISDFDITKMPVPYPSLTKATDGIGPAELWYWAMRLGEGKTHMLCDIAANIAKCGYNVGMASLEMRAKVVSHRVALRLAGNRDKALTNALRSGRLEEQKEALDTIHAMVPGSISIFDPSHGKINTTSSIHDMCHDFDIVFVDHVGLLTTADGRRAIDDWRAQATISNVLREITLSTTTPIFAAAQINREGQRVGSQSPPKASHLAQSDALGQDADVVVTGKRLSARVSVFSAEKVREGPNLRWHTRFDIPGNRIEEISREQAMELGVLDADAETIID